MPTEFQYDVFLSHNKADKPRVRHLAKRLKDAGLRVWFDEWKVSDGDIIALKVDEGLEQSRVLLLCLSPNALGSDWVALERGTAIHRDPANKARRFIPLLLADCELPDTLRRYKYVDFREETETAFENLLADCRPFSFQPAIRSDLAQLIERAGVGNRGIRWKPNFKRRAFLLGAMTVPLGLLIYCLVRNPKQLSQIFSQAEFASSNVLLVISALLLCGLTLVATMSAYRAGLARQNDALETLAGLISKRVKKPELLTPIAIRGLARSIEGRFRCTILTDKLIAESIRSAALLLEISVKGPTLVIYVRLLNDVLRHFDEDGPPLLSIAEVDRLFAFKHSQLFLCCALCVIAILYATLTHRFGPTIALLVAQLAVLSSSVQANFMWSQSHNRSVPPRQDTWARSSLRGLFPFDFFLRSVTSPSRWAGMFWTKIWAAFWEMPIMHRNYWRKERFAAMHEFRFDVASQLFRKLCNAQREIDIAAENGKSPPAHVMSEHSRLSVQLWIVTGDLVFIGIAQRGRFSEEDLQGSIMQCLLV